MKKIMFNDHYGLTEAVLQGRKTVTRRVIDKHRTKLHRINKDCSVELIGYKRIHSYNPPYKIGEIVAVAQSYYSIMESGVKVPYKFDETIVLHKGWCNKMFVQADLMPHQVRILDVRAERLQDITEEDYTREGVRYINDIGNFYFERKDRDEGFYFNTAKEAFATLIDKISGKGTWESNPFVWRIEFELVR